MHHIHGRVEDVPLALLLSSVSNKIKFELTAFIVQAIVCPILPMQIDYWLNYKHQKKCKNRDRKERLRVCVSQIHCTNTCSFNILKQ